MLGKLFRYFSQSRITVAAKELKLYYDACNPTQKAKLLIFCTAFRLSEEKFNPAIGDMYMNPVNYPPEECYRLYYRVEGLFLEAKGIEHQVKKNFREPIGYGNDQILGLSIQATHLKIWMSTVGVRIKPDTYNFVNSMWDEMIDIISNKNTQEYFREEYVKKDWVTGTESNLDVQHYHGIKWADVIAVVFDKPNF